MFPIDLNASNNYRNDDSAFKTEDSNSKRKASKIPKPLGRRPFIVPPEIKQVTIQKAR